MSSNLHEERLAKHALTLSVISRLHQHIKITDIRVLIEATRRNAFLHQIHWLSLVLRSFAEQRLRQRLETLMAMAYWM